MKDKMVLINGGINVDASLELFGDMETYDETLAEYLNGVAEKISQLKNFKEVSDTYNYAIVAHSLKSDSKYLGFTKLAEICFNHEQAGKRNDITYIYNDFDNLINEANRINTIVNTYMGNSAPTVEPVVEPIAVEPAADKYILVVDDSDIITGYIKKIFSNEYGIIVATDGEKAIQTINGEYKDKIIGMLLDLNLPKVSGFEVLEYLNANNLFAKIPVTVITGSDSTNDINKVFTYPVVDVLNKPFNERDLKNTLIKMFN